MLTKRLMETCVMSIAMGAICGAGIAAQGATAKSTAAQDAGKQTVTVTGCLQGPVPVDEYAPSAADASAGGATFRLTNVTTKPMPANGTTYLVIGSEKQLTAQLGHQVQIVGTAQPGRGGAAESAVRVESVRMLSTKCGARR
jgi:hypothetical protein